MWAQPSSSLSSNDNTDAKKNQDEDMLDVDFEWFDPQPAVDFHGIKTLLRQLFDVDNQLFDISALSDLILSQPLLGSTVKVDGNETDPFAFLTVLNLRQHKDNPIISQLTNYIASKCATISSLTSDLPRLLQDETKQIGLILTERFINMPSQIITPCYTMLQEEITWALEEKEPYDFTHYLILSKTYQEVDSKLDAQENRPNKKGKKAEDAGMTFYFHPEDEKLHEYSVGWGNFEFEKATDEGASDAKRAFQEAGIKPMGHLTLIEAAKFDDAIKGIGEYLSG